MPSNQTACDKCKCVFEFDIEDVEIRTSNSKRFRNKYKGHFVKCPVCQIPKEVWPAEQKDLLAEQNPVLYETLYGEGNSQHEI